MIEVEYRSNTMLPAKKISKLTLDIQEFESKSGRKCLF